jgi:hypothetical protein
VPARHRYILVMSDPELIRREDAIERLVEVASRRTELVDWEVLETIEETAWRD